MFVDNIRMSHKEDPYILLNVSRDSNDATIKKAYRKMCKHHPDRNKDDPQSGEKFKIKTAYEQIGTEKTENYLTWVWIQQM